MERDETGRSEIEIGRTVRRAPMSSGRRRPSGEPPPLPRELGRTGRFWLFMVAYFVTVVMGVLLFQPFAKLFEGWDAARLRWVVDIRTGWLTAFARWVNLLLASPWAIRILRYGTILGLIVYRRWRHLFVFLGTVIALELMTYQFSLFIMRPRPFDVKILAPWDGFSMPSRPAAGLAVTLIGMAYALVVQGRWRYRTKWAIGVVLGTVVLARVYLAVDAPTAAGFGAILGIAFGVTAFRWFTPNDVFPVTYHRGKSAHLDVSGRRGEAITKAVREQLGYEVLEAKLVGIAGSGGSTPLRLHVSGPGEEPEHYLFAKLYAKSHVRADHWYKLGRTILYGALEDETPFGTVRRFVEYEDYALRLLYDVGLTVPRPYGIVEITPEREYMIVMEFFDDAVEISEAEVTPHVIDQGLQMIRMMWDQGIAHRDVKPANLMVQAGELRLIDVFFVQIRPSPWRQAVDLANMMMVLGLRSDAESVYRAALTLFTEDEIAEAFAATRGVASPTQLRSMMKEQGHDLLTEFRELAPPRPPIAIQRWSIRRAVLTLSVLFGLFLVVGLIISNWAAFA
jgi:tRNA A-37 threonylcarbamoyl transferase component Bud32